MPRRQRKGRRPQKGLKSLEKDVRKLKMLASPEFKWIDKTDNSTVDTTGQIIDLNTVAQGDDDTSRDGNVMRMMSVQLSWYITQHASATNSRVRFVLFLAKAINGTKPTVAQVLLSTNAEIQFRNLDERHNIVILKDWKCNLQSASRTQAMSDFYKKINVLTRFDATDGNITAMQGGYLGLLQICNESVNTPTMVVKSRVRFIDS